MEVESQTRVNRKVIQNVTGSIKNNDNKKKTETCVQQVANLRLQQ